jgi:hypothetical protein
MADKTTIALVGLVALLAAPLAQATPYASVGVKVGGQEMLCVAPDDGTTWTDECTYPEPKGAIITDIVVGATVMGKDLCAGVGESGIYQCILHILCPEGANVLCPRSLDL